jgi:hypothetical protein
MDPNDRDAWRPMGFGPRKSGDVEQPLIEPLWEGLRVLVHWERPTGARIVEAGGVIVTDRFPEVAEALAEAFTAETVTVDGYLTAQATRSGEGTAVMTVPPPTPGEMMGQMVLGKSGERALAGGHADPPVAHDRPDVVAFVAVDLLELDDVVLFDVPLLERRRLLDSIVIESDLVRRGLFVRAPVEPWLISWRSIGFRKIALKAQNGRYRPGTDSDDWAVADIPKCRGGRAGATDRDPPTRPQPVIGSAVTRRRRRRRRRPSSARRRATRGTGRSRRSPTRPPS